MEYHDDPVITTATGYAIPRTAWALVQDGIIRAVVHTYDEREPPFEGVPTAPSGDVSLSGTVAIRVTGTGAMVGHLVDSRGNVTPAEGRTTALRPGVAAYHDGTAVQRRPVEKALEDIVPQSSEAEPEPAPEIPPPDKPSE